MGGGGGGGGGGGVRGTGGALGEREGERKGGGGGLAFRSKLVTERIRKGTSLTTKNKKAFFEEDC